MLYTPSHQPATYDGIHTAGWAAAIARDVVAATESVTLSALSLLPPRVRQKGDMATLCHALNAAARRGVTVRLILPAPTKAHPATSRNATAAEWARAAGCQVHLRPLPGLLHAKTALIDNLIAWVGSGNLTTAAASHNLECWLRVTHRQAAQNLAAFHARMGVA